MKKLFLKCHTEGQEAGGDNTHHYNGKQRTLQHQEYIASVLAAINALLAKMTTRHL